MARLLTLLAWCCIPASLAVASMAAPQPLFLINTSPSEPVGLYVRSPLPPEPGRLAAFPTPPPGRRYAQAHLPKIAAGGILKTLVAGPQSQVCAVGGVFSVDRRALGSIHQQDRAGRALPHWEGCRTLAAGEYVAFSDRIPNSFDSRYYGPVAERDLIGVFEPLWVRR